MSSRLSASDRVFLGIARLQPLGLAPAPGTCCSAAALLAAPFLFLPLDLAQRCAVLLLIFFGGSYAAGRAERILGIEDPPEVVIDEAFGMWLALLPLDNPSPALMLAAFVLFRFFDIVKPWPVSASEHWLPGGYGIMLDDAVAGLPAFACLGAAALFCPA
jgi:phosphatidylglycerophosphatase A